MVGLPCLAPYMLSVPASSHRDIPTMALKFPKCPLKSWHCPRQRLQSQSIFPSVALVLTGTAVKRTPLTGGTYGNCGSKGFGKMSVSFGSGMQCTWRPRATGWRVRGTEAAGVTASCWPHAPFPVHAPAGEHGPRGTRFLE